MMEARGKVVVAMSGGVDSSVAAALLVEHGFDVVGLFMRLGANGGHTAHERRGEGPGAALPAPGSSEAQDSSSRLDRAAGSTHASARAHQGCCSAADASDARYVAGMLGIPFYALNFSDDFERIIDYFADEYAIGRTPNPCVVCNNQLKFGRLIEYADAIGAEFIATGHYARIESAPLRLASVQSDEAAQDDGVAPAHDNRDAPALCRAADSRKDQSYFLFGLDRRVLHRVKFPLGRLHKDEVRDIARRRGFPNSDKPDSVEICFVPERNYASVVRRRRPESFREGDVLNAEGAVIGRHGGLGQFTVGQRRGLGIALGKPAYVTRLDVLSNTVTLGPREALLSQVFIAGGACWLADVPESFRATVKIRYLHAGASARVERLDADRVRVTFDEPQSAITPGQAAVFYDGDRVLGGAWIDAAEGRVDAWIDDAEHGMGAPATAGESSDVSAGSMQSRDARVSDHVA